MYFWARVSVCEHAIEVCTYGYSPKSISPSLWHMHWKEILWLQGLWFLRTLERSWKRDTLWEWKGLLEGTDHSLLLSIALKGSKTGHWSSRPSVPPPTSTTAEEEKCELLGHQQSPYCLWQWPKVWVHPEAWAPWLRLFRAESLTNLPRSQIRVC